MPNKRKTVRSLDLPPDAFGGSSLLTGSSGNSSDSVAPPPVAPPDAPSNVTVSAALLSSECHPAVTLTVSWTEPTLRIPSFYLIEYSTTSTFTAPTTLTATSVDPEITIGGLEDDTTYYVRVAAVAAQRSAWSSTVSIRTPTAATAAIHTLLVPTWGGSGASDGIWVYSSASGAWTLSNSGLPTGLGWYAVVVNPANDDEWVALGFDASALANTLEARDFGDIRIQASGPNNALRIYGTSNSPVWRTADSGATWAPVEVRGTRTNAAYDWLHLFYDDTGALHLVAREVDTSGGAPVNAGTITRWRGSASGVLQGVALTSPPGTPNYNTANISIRGACAGDDGDLLLSVFHYELNQDAGNYPILRVTSAGVMSVVCQVAGMIRSLCCPAGTRRLAGIRVDGNDQATGFWRSPDYATSTQILTTASPPDRRFVMALSDSRVFVQGTSGSSKTVEQRVGVFDTSGAYTASTVFGPLAGGETLHNGRANTATGTTAAANIAASTNTAPGKDVLLYDGTAWQRITGPAAATDDQLREFVEIASTPGQLPCVYGCPPNGHHANHEIGGCDPLILEFISGVITDAQHGSRSGGTLHATATSSTAGFLSAADKAKLDSLPSSFDEGVDDRVNALLQLTAGLEKVYDDAAGTLTLVYHRTFAGWFFETAPTTGDHQGPTYTVDHAMTVTGVMGYAATAPSGSPAIFDIEYKRGAGAWTSLFSTLPQFAAGSNTPSAGTLIASPTLNAGDLIRFNWDAVNGIAGATIQLKVKSR